jgi:hypothetical protein
MIRSRIVNVALATLGALFLVAAMTIAIDAALRDEVDLTTVAVVLLAGGAGAWSLTGSINNLRRHSEPRAMSREEKVATSLAILLLISVGMTVALWVLSAPSVVVRSVWLLGVASFGGIVLFLITVVVRRSLR